MNFNKLYLDYFSKKKVGKQLTTLFFLTVLIPILVVGLIVFIFAGRQFTKNYEYLTESAASQVRSVLVTTTLSVNETSETVIRDNQLQDLLSQDYQDFEEAQSALLQYQKFDEIMTNSALLAELKLYVDQDILQRDTNYSYFYPVTEQIKGKDWYLKASSTRSNFWMSNIRTGQAGTQYWNLNYYCRIPIPKTGSFAVLVLTVSNDHLRNLMQIDDYDIYASVNSDPVFISSRRNLEGNTFPGDTVNASAFYKDTRRMKILGEDVIGSLQTFRPYSSSDQIYILVTNTEALPYIHRIELGFLLAVAFAIGISALLIHLYTKYFNARIQTLRLAMYKVSHNDYEIVNSIQGDDELSATFHDLKSMVSKLKETEAKIYQAQIQEQILSNQQQQMELKLLANQINPHFLYNTLETIRMKALTEGNREVATAIKLLGKSMRYVLNNTKSTETTLDKEIDYIATYLAIQKMRFGSRLNYTIRIDEKLDLKHYQILPLLIQPIVENAISHGLEDSGEEGHIILKIYKDKDLLIADVFDNGIGMTGEKLADVTAHLSIPQPESDHGVGLYNINNRIRLFYGDIYGLTIRSRPDYGTLVTLTIPLLNLTEEEE